MRKCREAEQQKSADITFSVQKHSGSMASPKLHSGGAICLVCKRFLSQLASVDVDRGTCFGMVWYSAKSHSLGRRTSGDPIKMPLMGEMLIFFSLNEMVAVYENGFIWVEASRIFLMGDNLSVWMVLLMSK